MGRAVVQPQPQHTPGPWNLDSVGKLLSVAMSHEKAWMHFDPAVSSFGYDATEEMRANARLIAAAIAQEAADDARDDCECEGECPWEECGPCSERFGNAIVLRRAAIAKVRGQ